ncbi:MAG: DinB family protein [Phycisphaerae bacterium]|nr:DinB family protein [Phycisphaerae bacterium]
MNASQALAEGIDLCKPLMVRYLAGFADSTRAAQAPGLPNHVAWSLGHCALTMHRVAERVEAVAAGRTPTDSPGPLCAQDFTPGPRGDSERFGAESIAFGSTPAPDAANFPTMARCVAAYDAACDRLAAALRSLDPDRLDATIPYGSNTLTVRAVALRMVFHNGDHCGQIADLRRALGMKSIFA